MCSLHGLIFLDWDKPTPKTGHAKSQADLSLCLARMLNLVN